jgi:Ni/Co efflux regulator RcnB
MGLIRIVTLACCAGALSLTACAEKPVFAGGPPARHEQADKQGQDNWQQPGRERRENERHEADRRDQAARAALHFEARQRDSVRDYYAPKVKAGRCPPGLAKKHNGCLPPGQAKKWQLGQPLPSGLKRYALEAELRRRLGTPPAGYEYARVAGDILLLEIGTRMVVDAIENLGGF